MVPVPVTLASTVASTLLNLWLGGRIAALRKEFRVSVGDGGQEPLLRRMRAQANFIENAPFVLILLGGLELSGANRAGLTAIAVIFIVARILHAIGMDGSEKQRFRMFGMIGSSLVTLALVLWATSSVVLEVLGR
ncbi:MAPEG family protein [Sphingomonas agri]|uniref:MAPEG family protein n=1 Tax=Sphingomonas agri TaxID=1813878 RepID=UPI00311DE646